MSKNADLRASVDAIMPRLTQILDELVRIRSVSSDPERRSDVRRSAELVREHLADLGFDARVSQVTGADGTVGQPAVLAHRRPKSDGPTVLLYAHHDVQPAGDPARWTTPPFELTERGDRLYGRGSGDDGAGIVVHLGALMVLGADFPLNITVFIEGEEEIGSPTFTAFLEKYRAELEADVIIVADSNNWDVHTPALTTSLRGVADCDVRVQVLEQAVHSGMYGGPILDAVTVASRLISALHDDDGAVAVPGLGGESTAQVRWEEADFRSEATVLDGYRLAGRGDLASRVWSQPALTVIGFDATPTELASNTIAPECTFRLSLRTAPGECPERALRILASFLEDNAPWGAQVTVTTRETGRGYEADLAGTYSQKMRKALEQAWGVAPVNIGVGGSIPFISEFQTTFPDAEVLVTGVEDPETNAHGEDESASKTVIRLAALAQALFLAELDE